MQKVNTFFMFDGHAEEAMNLYVSLFEHSEIKNIQRYGKNEAGKEGTIMLATFSIDGQEFMCIDSPAKHAFTFTPAMSLYINCKTEAEVEMLYKKLSENGQVLMPLDKYPFSDKFGWVNDRFGVSWQLSFKN